MASPFYFVWGLVLCIVGVAALVTGRGYIAGRPVDGRPMRLSGAALVFVGSAVAVLIGILGVF